MTEEEEIEQDKGPNNSTASSYVAPQNLITKSLMSNQKEGA